MTRKTNKIVKTFKDYLVPILGVLLIFIMIIASISGDSNKVGEVNDISGEIGELSIIPKSTDTEAYIMYTGGSKKLIDDSMALYPTEKVFVKIGNLDIISDNYNFVLSDLAEFRYDSFNSFSLLSGKAWLKSISNLEISMKYLDLSIPKDSVISLDENEVSSTLYVLEGTISVGNNLGENVMLTSGEKISILRTDNSLLDKKSEIDSLFKESNWFILNNGGFYLNQKEENISIEGNKKESIIEFTSIEDEQEFNNSKVNISGNILSEEIGKIELGGIEMNINVEDNIFTFNEFELKNRVNDLVYKVYDIDNNILNKGVITLYNISQKNTSISTLEVENFSLDQSMFRFVKPNTNPYVTNESVVRIDGEVPVGKVYKILVNNYKLKSFREGGRFWHYFANKQYGNLKEGLNIYKVEYFDKEGKLISSNAYTIIIEHKKKIKIISDELKIN